MTAWFRVAFDHAVTHCVPRSLLAPLVIEMAERDHSIKDFEKSYGIEHARALGDNPAPVADWSIDFGGMCYANMPIEDFEIDGLTIGVFVDSVDGAASRLLEQPIRRFASGECYLKFKYWHFALVLTPEQRNALHAKMVMRGIVARERAAEFFAAVKARREVCQ